MVARIVQSMAELSTTFFENGWCHFPYDPALAAWVEQTLPEASRAVQDPINSDWLRCGGTWFAGVNVLHNDATGAVDGRVKLVGPAVQFIHDVLGLKDFAWDRAQISICYPGYPNPMAGETEAAFRYRNLRDASHLDGLLPEGVRRRRHLRECHGFILGIPMVDASPDASPFVIWEGSHEIIRATFRDLFQCMEPADWGEVDATEVYLAARRDIFERCNRVEISASPGEAYLVHRLALHGVAPWKETANAGPHGRMIAYFRPEIGGPVDWLNAP